MRNQSLWRGVMLAGLLNISLAATAAQSDGAHAALTQQLAALEKSAGGRLGIAWIDTDGARYGYRADERFPMTSTFKTLAVAAILHNSIAQPGLLEKKIPIREADRVTWTPVTGHYFGKEMSIAALCAAAIEYSDNLAANYLLQELGGPQGVTAYARSLGDTLTRLDRREPALNSAQPGDLRDTSTPAAMAANLQTLTLGEALPTAQRQRLISWLKQNTTGDQSIRAGVPAGWTVGDKTGAGAWGATNDLAILWPEKGAPKILAVYFIQSQADAANNKAVLASATRQVIAALAH